MQMHYLPVRELESLKSGSVVCSQGVGGADFLEAPGLQQPVPVPASGGGGSSSPSPPTPPPTPVAVAPRTGIPPTPASLAFPSDSDRPASLSEGPHDAIGPIWPISQLRIFTLISSAKSLLALTHSQVPGMWTWTSMGGPHSAYTPVIYFFLHEDWPSHPTTG